MNTTPTTCPVAIIARRSAALADKVGPSPNEDLELQGCARAVEYMVATSKEGLTFQLEWLEAYADGVHAALINNREDADEGEAEIVVRLAKIIRQGLDRLNVAA